GAVWEEVHAYFTFKEGPQKSTKEKIQLHHQEYKTKYTISGLTQRDPQFQDEGYLLISAFRKTHNQVIVELLSLADNQVIHRWVPPVSSILEQTPNYTTGPNTTKGYRAMHPLLLEDGSLIFTSGAGPMVRIDACSNVVWVLNHRFHHSIELNHEGNIVTCSKLEGDGPNTVLPIKDDGIAIISPDGEFVDEISITKLLLENGYAWLIYGIGKFEKDRLHLNDAQPILIDNKEAKTGDILISSRHLSTVALLDPKSESFKWLKTGPWLSQHDINQLSDGRYSIFGNDVIRGYEKTGTRYVNQDKSEIYIYDPHADTISKPFSSIMAKEKIASKTQGRSKILANGDLYIEQTDLSRIVRISEDKVRWEYVNTVSENTVGALHWSRYLSAEDMDLSWLDNAVCN
ncbi:MAG: arylsulfotransferase family protein, partial [Desulfobulbia bacterium]